MRINNNLMALNTHRQLGLGNTAAAKSMEKLSSGYRINRAGDDAAGLAISEKMRGQIRGLMMASKNAQDGISLIQTAEGALQETHAILQRMRELAVQAATDTNTDADRAEIQKEIDQLAAEVTRIAKTTQFNTKELLDGSLNVKFHIGANAGQNVALSIGAMDSDTLKVGQTRKAKTVEIDDNLLNLLVDENDVDENDNVVLKWFAAGATIHDKIEDTDSKVVIFEAVVATEAGYYAVTAPAEGGSAQGTATLRIAVDEAYEDGTEVIVGIDVSDQTSADTAITTINAAIEKVSAERSKLGAMQNRLEHTIKNLDTSAENLQAAESRIRDVDMAKEMMEFTKQNILQQAAQAMLAHANQAPQGVLQLLR